MEKRKEMADEVDLDALFKAAQDADPVPSADLMARVLADSVAVQAGFAAQAVPVRTTRGWLAQAKEMVGGWAGASALTAVMCMGLIFGFSAPETVMNFMPGAETAISDAGMEFLDLFEDENLEVGSVS